MTQPQHNHTVNETCLATPVSILFASEASQQKDSQLRPRLILTTNKPEEPVEDDDRDLSASGSNLARGDNKACLGGGQLPAVRYLRSSSMTCICI